MLITKNLNSVNGIDVYTDSGEYFGKIEEAILHSNKIDSWRVRATSKSYLYKAMPSAKCVFFPHHHVKAIGDIMLISRAAAPAYREE